MVDYTSAIRAQRKSTVNKFLFDLGLDVGTFNVSDTSESNMEVWNDALTKMYVAEVFAKSCLSLLSGCAAESLAGMANTVKNTFMFPSNIAQLLGYTESLDDPYMLTEKMSDISKKSAVIDSTYEAVTGGEPTETILDDMAKYEDTITFQSSASQAILNIGKSVIGEDYVPTTVNIGYLQDTLQDVMPSLEEYRSNQTYYAVESLKALNLKEEEIPDFPDAQDVFNELNTLSNELKNALTGGKFGGDFTTEMFANTKLSGLMQSAEKKLSQMSTYQKAVFIIKNACDTTFGIGQPLDDPTSDQTALRDSCVTFNGMTSSGSGLKDICNKIYVNNAVSPSGVKIVGFGSPHQIKGEIYSPAGLPHMIQYACEVFNGAWNKDADEIINFSYQIYTGGRTFLANPGNIAQYNKFIAMSGFFDDASNSDLAWVAWP